ncbi:YfbM family protein [Glycomyces xiaoerkulensis]|uniref:YfbM family protein n=1 Tax=Glycomyces xiaoerkulensis TaxID=2038139 RepID=UPI000C264DDD|nr:YfbM family protein [Glycomyces xiaoerkulensis]
MGQVISFIKVTPEELDRAEADPEFAERLLEDENRAEADPDGYLDKAWAGIEYLLDGAGFGLEFLMDGGLIDEEGTMFSWPPESVRELSERFGKLPFERLSAHFDPEAMTSAEVYPGVWGDDGDDLAYLESYYAGLVAFFEDAAASESAAVMSFTF